MISDVKAVFARVRSALRRRGASSHDADDLVQEAYLQLARYMGVRAVENPEGLLMRIAITLSIGAHHRRVRRGEDVAVEDPTLVVDLTPGAEATLLAKQQLARMAVCIERLPERTRHIFLANRLDERSYADIGRELGISTTSVERHMAKATELVASWMEGW